METVDNIELRSEKTRNLIGKVPPIIIRVGVLMIFIIVLSILSFAYFYKYDHNIKTSAIINPQNDSILVTIKIPANEIERIKSKQRITLNFDNLAYTSNINIVTEIKELPKIITIESSGGYYFYTMHISNEQLNMNNTEINIKDEISINAQITTDRISFIERLSFFK